MNWDGSERRKFIRVKFPCEISVHGHKNHIISTNAENISPGGVRVIIEEKLAVGSIVSLDIYAIKEAPISCKGRVIWIITKERPDHEGPSVFDTGIEFCEIKEEDVSKIKKLVVAIAAEK